jgi:hypothetical protein
MNPPSGLHGWCERPRCLLPHVVYKWLAQDLKWIGLMGGLAWSRQESAVVPFDMSALAHP